MTGAEGSQRLPAAAHKPERHQNPVSKATIAHTSHFHGQASVHPCHALCKPAPPINVASTGSRCSQLACSQTYKPTFGTSSVTCTAKSPARGGSGAPKRVLWGLTELVLSGQAAIMAIGPVRQLHALHASGTRLSEGTEPTLIWPRS